MAEKGKGPQMTTPDLAFKVAGVSTFGLGVIRIPQAWRRFFPFRREEIPSLNALNRKLFSMVWIALVLFLFAIAFLTVVYSTELGQGSGMAFGVSVT
jgi:cytochrome b561